MAMFCLNFLIANHRLIKAHRNTFLYFTICSVMLDVAKQSQFKTISLNLSHPLSTYSLRLHTSTLCSLQLVICYSQHHIVHRGSRTGNKAAANSRNAAAILVASYWRLGNIRGAITSRQHESPSPVFFIRHYQALNFFFCSKYLITSCPGIN